MAIKSTDKIRGASRGTPAQALSHIDGPDAKDIGFVYDIYQYAPVVFLDPAILSAQAAHETGGLTSSRWNVDLNPAGVGIVSKTTQQPFRIPNHTVASQLYISMMNRLIKDRKADEPWFNTLPQPIQDWLNTVWANHCKYAPPVHTVADLNLGYSYPSGDSAFTWAEDPQYAAGVVKWGAKLFPSIGNQKDATINDIVFGLVERPNILNLIVQKAYDGAGYTGLAAPRKLVGGCEHITDGRGSVYFYADFFGINGERALDALVDFVVDRNGNIAMLNDPWGYRSPWANGNVNGLQGNGPAFLSHFGVDGVNNRLFSTEHECAGSEDWTAPQIQATIDLDAFMFDSIGVRWDSYPVHQDFGVITHLDHAEFTDKGGNTIDECAGRWYHNNKKIIQDGVKAKLKKAQTKFAAGSTPSTPTPSSSDLPGGITEDVASKKFGSLRMVGVDGKINDATFNPKGQISLSWLARCVKENVFPSATNGWKHKDSSGNVITIVMFSNGWTLVQYEGKPRLGWQWVH